MQTAANGTVFDFVVGDIEFVLNRWPNQKWYIENLSNQRCCLLGFAADGRALYRIDGKERQIEKGDVLFFRKGQTHSAKSDPSNPWAYYSVAFRLLTPDGEEMDDIAGLPTVTRVKNFAEFAGILGRLNHAWTLRQSGYLLRCRGLLSELLYLLVQASENAGHGLAHEKAMEKITGFLAENYMKSYRVQELAELADMSPSYFRLLFKQYTGLTATQYQNQLKINKACDLLLSGTCNVTEAAYSVGFRDVYYFSRQFKKTVGISPKNYTRSGRVSGSPH